MEREKKTVLMFLEDPEEFKDFQKKIAESFVSLSQMQYELMQARDERDVGKFSEHLAKLGTIVVRFDCSCAIDLGPSSWFFVDFPRLSPKPLLIVVNDSWGRLRETDRERFGIDYVTTHQQFPTLLAEVLKG